MSSAESTTPAGDAPRGEDIIHDPSGAAIDLSTVPTVFQTPVPGATLTEPELERDLDED